MRTHNNNSETIAAIATPLAESGLGIIRLSGPASIAIAEKICALPHKKKISALPTHTLHVTSIVTPRGPIDQATIVVMRSPGTFTGEDMVEITTHGSPLILRTILRMIVQRGGRMAEPGEFTRTAFLNGKLDLTQAEAVADIIRAKTDAALLVFHQQLSGRLAQELNRMNNAIISMRAGIEARIDHPEDDIEPIDYHDLTGQCGRLIQQVDHLLQTAARGILLKDGLRVAIIGKPNAGKSSILNALLGYDRSIVTDEPGTTRDTIDSEFVFEDLCIRMIDTAGLRNHAFSKAEHFGIERSRQAADSADMILAVFDNASSFSDDDIQVHELARKHAFLGILNKNDLKPGTTRAHIKKVLKNHPWVAVSAKKGTGMKSLRKAIYELAGKRYPLVESSVIISSVRQENALRKASDALARTRAAAKAGEPLECIAFELQQAGNAFDEITGKTMDEEILDRIFSQFCIGK